MNRQPGYVAGGAAERALTGAGRFPWRSSSAIRLCSAIRNRLQPLARAGQGVLFAPAGSRQHDLTAFLRLDKRNRPRTEFSLRLPSNIDCVRTNPGMRAIEKLVAVAGLAGTR